MDIYDGFVCFFRRFLFLLWLPSPLLLLLLLLLLLPCHSAVGIIGGHLVLVVIVVVVVIGVCEDDGPKEHKEG